MLRRALTRKIRSAAAAGSAVDAATLNLTDSQLASVKVEPVEERAFPVERQAVGSIDFNEDMETQVFTPYQGKIIALFAAVGDDVKRGQTLFTVTDRRPPGSGGIKSPLGRKFTKPRLLDRRAASACVDLVVE